MGYITSNYRDFVLGILRATTKTYCHPHFRFAHGHFGSKFANVGDFHDA